MKSLIQPFAFVLIFVCIPVCLLASQVGRRDREPLTYPKEVSLGTFQDSDIAEFEINLENATGQADRIVGARQEGCDCIRPTNLPIRLPPNGTCRLDFRIAMPRPETPSQYSLSTQLLSENHGWLEPIHVKMQVEPTIAVEADLLEPIPMNESEGMEVVKNDASTPTDGNIGFRPAD